MSEKTKRAEASYQRMIQRPTGPGESVYQLNIRVSKEDRDAIAALAEELGLTQSALIRRKVLGKLPDALERRVVRAGVACCAFGA